MRTCFQKALTKKHLKYDSLSQIFQLLFKEIDKRLDLDVFHLDSSYQEDSFFNVDPQKSCCLVNLKGNTLKHTELQYYKNPPL